MKVFATIVLGLTALAAAGFVIYRSASALGLPFIDDLFPFNAYHYEDSGNYTPGNTTLSTQIKNIDTDWTTGNVTVLFHDEDTVQVTETSNITLTDETRLHWAVEGDTLHIRYIKNGARYRSDMNKALTITLPRSPEGINAFIDNTTGSVTVSGGTWNELTLKTTTGKVLISADTAETLKASCTTGLINAGIKSIGTADIHTTTGNIDLSADSFESLKVSATTGHITTALPEAPGFTADLSATTGKVSCELPHLADKDIYTVGDGSKKAKMHATTGNITIVGTADSDPAD